MRDLFLALSIIPFVPVALFRPQVGILVWVWISVMAPHRLVFGFMYGQPFLNTIAIVTIIGALINFKKMSMPSDRLLFKLILLFFLWTVVTTIFAADFDLSLTDLTEFGKTLLLCFLALVLMQDRKWMLALAAVFVLAIAFFGLKGGGFTLLSGGGSRVWGAPFTAWGDNNGVSVGMLIVTPLLVALAFQVSNLLLRLAGAGLGMMNLFALLGTHSRGGLVGLVAVFGWLAVRSKRKLMFAPVLVVGLLAGIAFMPENWTQRMETIQTYEKDASAMQRINIWRFAVTYAVDHPVMGGGYDIFFHAPSYDDYDVPKAHRRAVHSNYFQVLAEHGFIGLFMYLAILATSVLQSHKWGRRAIADERTRGAGYLLYAVQFSVVGYAANGLTLSMAYLDLIYFVLALQILLQSYVKNKLCPVEAAQARPEGGIRKMTEVSEPGDWRVAPDLKQFLKGITGDSR